MLIKVIRSRSDEHPVWLIAKLPDEQVFVSEAKEYEVHAISVFEGRINFQIVDDLRMITGIQHGFLKSTIHPSQTTGFAAYLMASRNWFWAPSSLRKV